MEDVDLCFTTNALHPCIMSEATIYGDLQQYHLYTTAKELEESNIDDKEDDGITKFETRAAFQPVTEIFFNDDRFSKQKLFAESIFTIIHRYTSEFKTENSFNTWCATAGLNFLLVECSRKTLKGGTEGKKRNRLLNVLKQKHHDKKKKKTHLAKIIASTLVINSIKLK
ncbi:hypothetical protein EDC94DRAFT_596178 [Helicostylum pulchrum]|nr:hypothetical protein EDC94DRAFT_596178 [Helicostylum pulchrum]